MSKKEGCPIEAYDCSLLKPKRLKMEARRSDEPSTDSFPRDALLKCGDREFRIDADQLFKRIPFLKTHLSSSKTDRDLVVYELDEVKPEVFEIIFNFVETGNFPEVPKDEDIFLELLSACHALDVLDLFDLCRSHLKTFISAQNYKTFFDFAKLNKMNDLMGDIVDYLALNFNELKNYLVNEIELAEMKMLLEKVVLREKLSENVIQFIFQWVKINLPERQIHLFPLISLVDKIPVAHFYLSFILSHEEIEQSPLFLNVMLEAVTKDRLKLFMISRTAFQYYSVQKKEWSPPTLFTDLEQEQVRATAFVWNSLYIFTGTGFIPFDIKSVFKCNIEDNTVERLKSIDVEGHFYLAVLNGIIFLLCSKAGRDRSSYLYINNIYYYDPSTNEFSLMERNFSSNIVYYVMSAGNSALYVYDEPEEGVSSNIICYDVTLRHRKHIDYPEPSINNFSDISTSCLEDFYLIRHNEEIDSFSWKRHEPKPVEKMETMRRVGVVNVRNAGNRFTCKVCSRNKTFFRYDETSKQWEKNVTEEGPEEIRYVWKGPSSPHLRLPFIYLLDKNWILYQYEPKNMEWTSLGLAPNREKFCKSLPFWTMGC